ncbi:Solute carrier family 13 member 5 [Lamellibrachia satsuma]|nr:Solute carrier family 13 member 5 [Lamellibrachia satsuma]
MVVLRILQVHWRSLVVVLTPLVFLPLVLVNPTPELKAAYGVLVMAMYWMTEAIPLPATALMPMFLFPMLGLRGAKDVAVNYLKDTNMLILGGLVVALSVENSDLHRRIALSVLRVVGVQRRWLMLGFMLPTWFLSMWISNTATTAMMFPVASAVLDQFAKSVDGHETEAEEADGSKTGAVDNKGFVGDDVKGYVNDDLEMNSIEINGNPSKQEDAADAEGGRHQGSGHSNFCKALSLCIAYAANVGGTATLTGTGPNLVFKGVVDELYNSHGLLTPITFTSWMLFALPGAAICLVVAWIWLQLQFLGFRSFFQCSAQDTPELNASVKRVIQEEYRKLGPVRFAEVLNAMMFFVLAMLWFFRDPRFVPGWGSLFKVGYMTDASAALIVCLLIFALPSRRPSLTHSGPGLLDWHTVTTKLPWGVMLLIGGGFALADVCKVSGLSAAIGTRLAIFQSLPPWLMVGVVAALVAGLTEFTSNVATSSLLLPILADLSEKVGMNPLYLMLPGVIAASFAFMLPVATPPNAIVFANGYLKVTDMAKAGVVMNILCVVVVTIATNTWAMSYFELDKLPWETGAANNTSVAPV